MPVIRIVALTCTFTALFLGQQTAAPPNTRAEEIEQERARKAAALKPEDVSTIERFARDFKDKRWMDRIGAGYNGFRVKLGDMITGGGFAAGPEYYRQDLRDGNLTVRGSAQATTKAYVKIEAETTAPKLWNGLLELQLLGTYRNYGGVPYYGPGPDSSVNTRVNYRLEDTSSDGIAILHPRRHFLVGGSIGGLRVNVGPGTDSQFPSLERIFSGLPGLEHQTNYWRNGAFVQLDFRDNPNGPKSGGNYVLQYSWYHDYKLGMYGFRRTDIDLQQLIPFLNKTHRFALRAKAAFSESDSGQITPFYLQPVLGGSDDLRGFPAFRFSDHNKVVYNAEYQWEVFAGLEGALFFDAGKVMPRRGLLAFSDLETSAGFGLRFNALNATFIRIDVGFSHEGFQVWFKFNEFFNARRIGTTTGQPIY